MSSAMKNNAVNICPACVPANGSGAFGLTEPNAGTDASAQQTMAVKEGEHYVLNGSKIFITNAAYAHVYIVMAMTDKAQGTRGFRPLS